MDASLLSNYRPINIITLIKNAPIKIDGNSWPKGIRRKTRDVQDDRKFCRTVEDKKKLYFFFASLRGNPKTTLTDDCTHISNTHFFEYFALSVKLDYLLALQEQLVESDYR